MRRRKAPRVRSSAGHVGSQGERNARLSARSRAHSVKSAICGMRKNTPSPSKMGNGSDHATERKSAI